MLQEIEPRKERIWFWTVEDDFENHEFKNKVVTVIKWDERIWIFSGVDARMLPRLENVLITVNRILSSSTVDNFDKYFLNKSVGCLETLE